MEPGTIFGKIQWLPESAGQPIVWSRKTVEKAGGIVMTEPLVRVVDGRLKTWVCRTCRVGEFEY
jgi:hypothetical protein